MIAARACITVGAFVLALSALPRRADAQQRQQVAVPGGDTIVLHDGQRLTGTLTEMQSDHLTILLANGQLTVVPASLVHHVERQTATAPVEPSSSAPPAKQPPPKHRTSGLAIAGWITVGLGIATVLTGATIYFSGALVRAAARDDKDARDGTTLETAGGITAVAGLPLIIGGAILVAIGKSSDTNDASTAPTWRNAASTPADPSKPATLLPILAGSF